MLKEWADFDPSPMRRQRVDTTGDGCEHRLAPGEAHREGCIPQATRGGAGDADKSVEVERHRVRPL